MPLLKKESGKNNSSVALLLIDVINDLDFDRADDLLAQAVPMVSKIAALKREAAQLQIPTVYVNDNFSQEVCFPAHGRALLRRQFARPGNLTGTPSDYFVLKPKHSGFYATTLDVLLEYLKVDTLIITGIAANICVLFTANDAYMRDYRLCVPADCVASNTAEETEYSLRQMKNILKADIRASTAIDLSVLKERLAGGNEPLSGKIITAE